MVNLLSVGQCQSWLADYPPITPLYIPLKGIQKLSTGALLLMTIENFIKLLYYGIERGYVICQMNRSKIY